jgi:hypothetical protein
MPGKVSAPVKLDAAFWALNSGIDHPTEVGANCPLVVSTLVMFARRIKPSS